MKIIEKLFGKKKNSPEVVSEYWQTGVKSIRIPMPKEYSSSKGRYIEIVVAKKDNTEKALVQFNELTEWSNVSPNRHTELDVLLTAEEIAGIGHSLIEAAQMVEDYTEEEK